MVLYTELDKQIDKSYEMVSIIKSISKQKFYVKILVLLPIIFNVSKNIKNLFL